MGTYIFCRGRGTSLEDVVPEAIGGTKTIEKVCRACNSDFGTRIDAKLVDHPAVQMQQARLGINGKSGVPQPLGQRRLARPARPARVGSA